LALRWQDRWSWC